MGPVWLSCPLDKAKTDINRSSYTQVPLLDNNKLVMIGFFWVIVLKTSIESFHYYLLSLIIRVVFLLLHLHTSLILHCYRYSIGFHFYVVKVKF